MNSVSNMGSGSFVTELQPEDHHVRKRQKTLKKDATINDLATDTLCYNVFAYLDTNNLIACDSVCSRWSRVITHEKEKLWRKVVKRGFHNDQLCLLSDRRRVTGVVPPNVNGGHSPLRQAITINGYKVFDEMMQSEPEKVIFSSLLNLFVKKEDLEKVYKRNYFGSSD